MAEYTALVVDDIQDNREIFRNALEMAGYVVSEAVDGLEAIEVLDQHVFDLLILDLNMPNMDGASVIKKLRKDLRYSRMRIIVATANPQMVTGEMDLLVDHIVYKPFQLREFVELARRMKTAID